MASRNFPASIFSLALALQTEIGFSIFWRPGGRRGLFGRADRSETQRKSESIFLILDSAGWGDENQLPMKNKSPAGCYGEQERL
jgi:hypothetical protein